MPVERESRLGHFVYIHKTYVDWMCPLIPQCREWGNGAIINKSMRSPTRARLVYSRDKRETPAGSSIGQSEVLPIPILMSLGWGGPAGYCTAILNPFNKRVIQWMGLLPSNY
nr:hypothetical protein Q903MT_gene777 [Picea sitchensis]